MPRAAVHLTDHDLERFRENRLGPEERRRALAHLMAGCEPCRDSARRVFFPGQDVDFSRVFRRLHALFLEAEAEIKVERQRGHELWRLLEPLDQTERLLWAKNDPRLHVWGVYERILQEARQALRQDPREAVALAHLGWMIAQRLNAKVYGSKRVRDFQGVASTLLGNAKRLYGDLHGAGEDLDRAEALLAQGTGDLLETASLLSVRASLKTDLGDFESAAALLRKAGACARQMGDRHLEGKYLIAWSSSIGWLDPERGLELAGRGLERLEEGTDPHLELGARHLQALWANELGRTADARQLLEACRPLYDRYSDPVTRGRLLRLEGLLARNEGRLEEAERCFTRQVELYEKHNFDFDLALAGLDLAEVLSQQGRLSEAISILSGLYPVLKGWNLHVDILRSWLGLQETLQRNAAQAEMFRELAMTMRRKWHRR